LLFSFFLLFVAAAVKFEETIYWTPKAANCNKNEAVRSGGTKEAK
jgi:hypothetical protein